MPDIATLLGYLKDFFTSVPWLKFFESLKTLITGVNWDTVGKIFDKIDFSSGILQKIFDAFEKIFGQL